MSTVLPKSEMSEEDVKLQYITPAITSKWDRGKITMETQVTDGKINLKGNFVFREKPKRADYILYLNANNPIAIIEAKDNKHSISHGLQQAMTYARMLDLPCLFSKKIRSAIVLQALQPFNKEKYIKVIKQFTFFHSQEEIAVQSKLSSRCTVHYRASQTVPIQK